MNSTFVYRAALQELVEGRIRCLTCERRCLIAPGETGWCKTRENRNGTLVTLTYGSVSSISVNPIEKKPLYHFYPGSMALTAGSWSCNLACPWCQNWQLSQASPNSGQFYSPVHFVAEAVNRKCQGVSLSFNEPTLSLEWSLEVFRLARQAGLYNTFITNGYMTDQALALLARAGLDAMNVDLKGDVEAMRTYCQADVEVVWRNLRRARELGIWVEITTLVIPGVNDQLVGLIDIANRILQELGPIVPWHLSRYHPAYQFSAPLTPERALEEARTFGREIGLQYIYIGNIPGHFAENTYCPHCGKMLIQRWGLKTVQNLMPDSCCPSCGTQVAGVGWSWRPPAKRR